MIDLEHYENKSQEYILEEVKSLTKKIIEQQKKADANELTTYGGALGIQDLRRDRSVLQSLLTKPTLIVWNK